MMKLAIAASLALTGFVAQAGVPTPEPAAWGPLPEPAIGIGGGGAGTWNPFPEKDPVNPFGDWLNRPFPGFDGPFPGPDPDPVLPIIKPGKP